MNPLPDYEYDRNGNRREVPVKLWRIAAAFPDRSGLEVEDFWATTCEGAIEAWEFDHMSEACVDAAQCIITRIDSRTDKAMGIPRRFNPAERSELIERLARKSQGGAR